MTGPVPRLMVGLDNFAAEPPAVGWGELLDLAQAAEQAGIDVVSVVDHVALGGDLERYPYGAFPGGADAHWLEPLTVLAAIAGRTSRIRLATGVLIAALRPPVLLAKTVATLDQLSGGRVELGVGTGWLAKEYEAAGLPFTDRGSLLDDALEVCQALWSGQHDFHSDRLNFTDVHAAPHPVAGPALPIWVGGALHPRNVNRIVRHASGWIPAPNTPARELVAAVTSLRANLARHERAPEALRVRVTASPVRDAGGQVDLAATFDRVARLMPLVGALDVYVAHSAFGGAPDLFSALRSAFVAAFEPVDRADDAAGRSA